MNPGTCLARISQRFLSTEHTKARTERHARSSHYDAASHGTWPPVRRPIPCDALHTAPNPPNKAPFTHSFMSIGDWGDTGAKEVAPQMAKYNPEFILAIGDNFYDKGVTGVDDPQWKDKFEDTFTGESLQVPWYVCAGNHDYYGGSKGIQAEIDYSNKSSRWTFPDLYFSKDVTSDDGTTVRVISIDTWRINGGDTFVAFDPVTGRSALRNITDVLVKHQTGVITEGTAIQLLKHFSADDEENPLEVSPDDEQLKFIADALNSSTADWNIVLGHFPIHSCTTGEHGDTPSLIKYVQPILEQYNADMYFNGHDHILQHILVNNVHYFGSGAGAREHNGINDKYEGLQGYHEGTYGFMIHEGNKTALTTTFISQDGSKTYTYTITK